MGSGLSETGLSKLFKQIENCAVMGARCPQKEPHGILTNAGNNGLGILARRGRIRIDIYAHNWRVITIMEGPHTGKHTALPDPMIGTGKPYKSIYKDHIFENQRGEARAEGPQSAAFDTLRRAYGV